MKRNILTRVYSLQAESDLHRITAGCVWALEQGKPYEVKLSPVVGMKSWHQLRLWHKWLTEIEKHGRSRESHDNMNARYNEMFVLPIFIRDDVLVHGVPFSQTWANLEALRLSGHEQYLHWRTVAMEQVSKESLNVKQMAEALGGVKYHAFHEEGVAVSEPSMRGIVEAGPV